MDAAREEPEAPTSEGPSALFDASTDAAAVVSGHGVVTGWTRAAEDLLGHPASDIVGSPAARLLAVPVIRSGRPASPSAAGPAWGGAVSFRYGTVTAAASMWTCGSPRPSASERTSAF